MADGTIKNKISGAVDKAVDKATSRKNILLITCDQYRFPRFSYGKDGGFNQFLKEILGFQALSDDNDFKRFFPGLMKLRKYATVLRNHMVAASACTPSRAVIYTGQYGTRTGVTQTDGLFKNGDANNFPWLDADGIPTLGTWMREAGYTTHYFGKWHVSNPPGHSLKRYGFDNWEESYPEPHGSQSNNLGVFRDAGFTDSACAFIRRQGLAVNYDRVYANMLANDPNSSGPKVTHVPWFAVASFTNPHDIATYPGVISQALPGTTEIQLPNRTISLPTQSPWGPLTIPAHREKTPAPKGGTMEIPLNPLNFPQDCANASPTQGENLQNNKPTCQYEYSYKMGLALASKLGFNVANAMSGASEAAQTAAGVAATLKSCIPFQLADKGTPEENCLEFLQLYAWLHAVVDPHIHAVLTALEESGQADNTIVVFFADHGEYGAAHGMMIEKWHTAYAEALHVPMVICSSDFNPSSDVPIQNDALTSHVDILPTVLGLAGIGNAAREKIAQELMKNRPVPNLPGIDLVPMLKGEWPKNEVLEADGTPRPGILFITDDEITAPLPYENDDFGERSEAEFKVYCQSVDVVIKGKPGHAGVPMTPGPVKQPNHVRCVRTPQYKLARYIDPSGKAVQEWEMYDLAADPNETTNLVQVAGPLPKALDSSQQATVDKLALLLRQLETKYLS
ncbi:MAG TPA: sulfatase-like hydrolase/transferase [Rhizomicrobium sp.]|nr:sulfatase-like hydrolase/transferase [Rhizomicrobium sp.]